MKSWQGQGHLKVNCHQQKQSVDSNVFLNTQNSFVFQKAIQVTSLK